MNQSVHGIVSLHKPSGMTSRAVVDLVVRLLSRTKVGHAGTLDPLASGVLIVCVGSATKLIEYFHGMSKVYRTVIRLGASSDTLDADGRVEFQEVTSVPDEAEVHRVLAAQTGEVYQMPPEYSALRINGRRAYDLARAGATVDLKPRAVRIDRVDLLQYAWPQLAIEVECGGGTYIRSIARDVGQALGCGGLVEALVRTRIGPFTLESSSDPSTLTPRVLRNILHPPVAAVSHLPRITLNETQERLIRQGRALDVARLAVDGVPGAEIALVGTNGRLIALGQVESSQRAVQPRKVLCECGENV